MRYIGRTYDRRQHLVEVEIVTDGDTSEEVGIGTKGSGLYFASEECVTIEGETEDVFSIVLRQTATVRLVTRDIVPDLFRADCREACVRISVGGKTVFAGFVMPRTYSQGYAGVLDTLEVNCSDRLGVLEELRWRDIGAAGVDYNASVDACATLTIQEILTEILGKVGFDGFDVLSAPLMEQGGISALVGIGVNERLFMGEDEDSVWSLLEVLEECLRYLNLHIMQDGERAVVFSWDDLKGQESVNVTNKNAYGTDTTLDIGECYNRIEVTCETEDVDDFIPDPLDSDRCTSPFSGSQLYCSEYTLMGGDPTTASNSFLSSKGENRVFPEGDEKFWKRDWWVRVMEAKGWRLYGTPSDRDITSRWNCKLPLTPDEAEKRDYYKQTILKNGSAEWQNSAADDVSFTHGAVFLDTATGKKEPKKDDNAVATDFEQSRYLVIGTGGRLTSINAIDDTEYSAAMKAKIECATPRAVFTGDDYQLSPSDDDTTRYLDISGKIALAPFEPGETGIKTDFWRVPVQDFREDEPRRFYREYFRAQQPSDDPELHSQTHGGATGGLDMFCAEEARKICQYGGIIDSSGTRHEIDNFSKVGVLRCMLIVGDKCLVQTDDSGSMESYTWKTFKTIDDCLDSSEFYNQSFTIGFDPQLNKNIVGEEYDIIKNAPYSLRLDAKGTLIPVRKSDNLRGKVYFVILGPNRVMIPSWMALGVPGTIPWISPAFGTSGTAQSSERLSMCIFNLVSGIWLKDLDIKILSDNAYDDPLNENDLVYVSDTDESFVNVKDDITMRIHSDLTAEERRALGIRDVVRNSIAVDMRTGNGVLSVWDVRLETQAKPEQLFVDWYYRECSVPRVELEQSVRAAGENPMLNSWVHRAMPAKTFFPLRVNRDLQEGNVTIKMRSNDKLNNHGDH